MGSTWNLVRSPDTPFGVLNKTTKGYNQCTKAKPYSPKSWTFCLLKNFVAALIATTVITAFALLHALSSFFVWLLLSWLIAKVFAIFIAVSAPWNKCFTTWGSGVKSPVAQLPMLMKIETGGYIVILPKFLFTKPDNYNQTMTLAFNFKKLYMLWMPPSSIYACRFSPGLVTVRAAAPLSCIRY